MHAMGPDVNLFALVREKLTKGLLWPLDGHVFAGSGVNGLECYVCDQPITTQDVEYEVSGPSGSVHVHLACYQAWEGECRRPA